jgi:hypothetical protein
MSNEIPVSGFQFRLSDTPDYITVTESLNWNPLTGISLDISISITPLLALIFPMLRSIDGLNIVNVPSL